MAAHCGEDSAVQRNFYPLARAGVMPGGQSHSHGDSAKDGSKSAGNGQGHKKRFIYALNLLINTRSCCDDWLPPPLVSVRAILAETRQRTINEPWINGLHGIVTNSQPVGDSRPEILNQNIGAVGQFFSLFAARIGLQVYYH